MTQRKTLRPFEARVAERVAEIDAGRQAYFQRDPDRPDARFIKSHGRVPPEVRKAQGRLRTSRWRSDMDRKRAPTASEVGMALAVALATTSNLRSLTGDDRNLVMRALHDLKARGYDIDQAKATMRRLRNKMMDPLDRQGEATESCAAPIGLPGEQEPLF
jgi:hypothetical protein